MRVPGYRYRARKCLSQKAQLMRELCADLIFPADSLA